MTGTADWRERSHDAEATVLLPQVPVDPANQPTLSLPVIPDARPLGGPESVTAATEPAAGEPTQQLAGGGGRGPGGGEADEGAGSVARNSAVMAVGSIVSRATGFVRTAAIGAAIGAAAVSNDYNAANTLPNQVYELLLGGVLSSVIVPLLVRARTRDADRGEAYAQRLLTLAAVFLGAATVLAVLAAPLLTRIVANSDTPAADRHLITTFSYLLLPEIFFYGMAALFAAILNTRGHFAAPMWTPILNNIVVIGTAVLFMLLPVITPPSADTLRTSEILVLGAGTTLGIVVQAIGLWPAMRKVGFRWKWRWDWRALHLGELGRVSAWMLAYVGLSQVGLIVVLRMANWAGDHGGPGFAIYNNAFLIFMMVHGIVAVSIMTALMPRMSAAAAEHRYSDVVDYLAMGTRLSAVILVPATAAYLVLGPQLGVSLFAYGEYTYEQGVQTGWVIAAAGVGLVPFAISQLQIYAFYAVPDTKTPALVNIPVVLLRVLLAIACLALPVTAVTAGLMLVNALTFVLGAAVGYWLLRRRFGPLGLRRVAGSLVRLSVAAAVAAVPAGLSVYLLDRLLSDRWLSSVVELILGGLILVAGYVGAALLLRVREVSELGGMLRGRLGR